MLRGNQLQNELVAAGLAEAPKPKKSHKGKSFKCRKCGEEMINPDYINAMWCPQCESSYFIFSDIKD